MGGTIGSFKARWLKGRTIKEVVWTAWQRGAMLGIGLVKLKHDSVHNELRQWYEEVLKRP